MEIHSYKKLIFFIITNKNIPFLLTNITSLRQDDFPYFPPPMILELGTTLFIKIY